MEIIAQLATFLKNIFSWWVIITPWEQAVFVRFGKHVKILKEGIYLRIPFIDQIYIQPIRLRTIDVSMQTVSTKDGKSVTIKSVISYSISDVFVLYNTISHPETTLTGLVMSEIFKYINHLNYKDIDCNELVDILHNQFLDNKYGLSNVNVNITSIAEVKTFRLIQDQTWLNGDLDMDKIK